MAWPEPNQLLRGVGYPTRCHQRRDQACLPPKSQDTAPGSFSDSGECPYGRAYPTPVTCSVWGRYGLCLMEAPSPVPNLTPDTLAANVRAPPQNTTGDFLLVKEAYETLHDLEMRLDFDRKKAVRPKSHAISHPAPRGSGATRSVP
jgi:hypothetical protein